MFITGFIVGEPDGLAVAGFAVVGLAVTGEADGEAVGSADAPKSTLNDRRDEGP